MVLADLPSFSANRRVEDFGHKLDLRILERVVVEFKVDNVLSSLVRSVLRSVKGEIPVEEVVVDKVNLDSRNGFLG
jgi:hypothetical protein